MALTALDYEEIKQLHARYAQSLDFNDGDEFVTCFAPDGVLSAAGEDRTSESTLREHVATAAAGSGGHVRHTTLVSALIEGDGDSARSLSYGAFTRDYGVPAGIGKVTKSRLLRSGMYEDDLVRLDGRWVYASRTFHRDGQEGVLKRFGSPLDIDHVDASSPGDKDESGMSALDYEAIRQLMTRYGYTLDFSDPEGFVNCFTADGAFELLTLGDPDFGGQARIEGTDALRDMAAALGPRVLGHVRHGVTNSLIRGDGERASVISYGLFTTDHGTPPRSTEPDSFMMETTGIYRDELVKVDGRWLFQTRTFRYDGWPDVVGRLGQPIEFGVFNF